jgi:Uma2 family endonuclease
MTLPTDRAIPQTIPPRPPRETLPTMYDLPSEWPEELGLPDEYHYLQPQLLSETFRLADYTKDRIFTAGDLNLYYDARHPLWYKRPDWFAALGVPRLYEETDLRLSYVLWQEGVSPSVVVELLSPGTEAEDLGQTIAPADQPPTKWQVYQDILRIPYYIVLDRYTDHLQAFTLVSGSYEAMTIEGDRPGLIHVDGRKSILEKQSTRLRRCHRCSRPYKAFQTTAVLEANAIHSGCCWCLS